MRTRKEIERWRWKKWLILFIAFGTVYNLFILLAGYLDGDGMFSSTDRVLFWAMNGLILPLMISITLSFSVRNASLFINDFNDLLNFHDKLLFHITKKGFRIQEQTKTIIHLTPTSWFYKLLKSWFGTEDIYITLADEIVIRGPLKKISDVEDILTWNPDFKK
ncbi:MAG: hypothetical protein JNM57_00375 [Cyclobacteriaceae bacterium]|nr:hypothetical protein [Cyclobacteriaceae bacterium]